MILNVLLLFTFSKVVFHYLVTCSLFISHFIPFILSDSLIFFTWYLYFYILSTYICKSWFAQSFPAKRKTHNQTPHEWKANEFVLFACVPLTRPRGSPWLTAWISASKNDWINWLTNWSTEHLVGLLTDWLTEHKVV